MMKKLKNSSDMGIMSQTPDKKPELSQRRADYANVLNKSLEIFVSHTEKKINDVMSKGLQPIADAAELDRIIVFRILERENRTFGEIYRWDKLTGGTAPLDPALQVLPATTAIVRWISIMSNDACISLRRNEFAEDEAAFLIPRGVMSILIVPVFVEREFWGVVTFHDNTNERNFDEDCTGLLRSTARLCANTIIRSEMEREILNTEVLKQTREADERTRLMLDATPLSCSLIDRNFKFIDCNKEAEKLYGVSSKQEYIDRFFEFSPEFQPDGQRSRDKAFNLFKQTFNKGYTHFEWEHLINSEIVPCEITLVRVKYKDDYIIAGYTHDLRELKAATARMREADERTQIIFDTAPVGCSMFDEDFNIFDCNYEVVKRFELPDKQVFLERFFDLSPEYQPCGRKSYDMSVEQNNKAFNDGYNRFEWMHQTLIGKPIPCEITQVRVKYKDKYVVAAYNRDLREQKALLNEIDKENERYKIMVRQQAEAEAASNAKSSFLSSMSHEMRTPMNAIIGMTEIGIGSAETERKDYALNKIKDASRHLLGVINEVLDMSKIEANKLELMHITFDLKHSLNKAVSLVQFTVDEKHLRFSMNIGDDTPSYLIGDDQRLTQVITNLLSNSVKFTPQEGSINLDVSFAGEENRICELRFEVADTGIGISPEQQEKIFNAFEQADSGTTRKFGGTGLGLVITKRIIELMGGRIWVESELGKGARFIFTIRLPRGERDSLPQTGFVKSEISVKDVYNKSNGKKMLLVEDIDINREILISLLDGTGIIVNTAENGKIAIDMVALDPAQYDIIFMDIQLPEMDGYEATRRIRALPASHAKKLPIIAMTANVFQEDIEKCRSVGMDDHIGKPLDFDNVLEKLLKYLN